MRDILSFKATMTDDRHILLSLNPRTTMDLSAFANEQEKHMDRIGNELEKIMDQAQAVVNKACADVRTKAQGLRSLKDADDPYSEKPSKTVSMAAQRHAMEERRRLMRETEKDESRLPDFCRLVDCLLVSESFLHIIRTYHSLLDLIVDPPEKL